MASSYITFRQFLLTGTYKIAEEFRKMLDKGVAAGAEAWIIDLRGNGGGFDADFLANYFLTDQRMLQVIDRNGPAGVTSAKPNFTLPPAYQLPIAIILNDRSGLSARVLRRRSQREQARDDRRREVGRLHRVDSRTS